MLSVSERISGLIDSELPQLQSDDTHRVGKLRSSMKTATERIKEAPMATVFHFVRTKILGLLSGEYAEQLGISKDVVDRFGTRNKGQKGRSTLRLVVENWQEHMQSANIEKNIAIAKILCEARELLCAAYVGDECYQRTYAYELLLTLLTPAALVAAKKPQSWEDVISNKKRHGTLTAFRDLIGTIDDFGMIDESDRTPEKRLRHPRILQARDVHKAHALSRAETSDEFGTDAVMIELEQILACHDIPFDGHHLWQRFQDCGISLHTATDMSRYRTISIEKLTPLFESLAAQGIIDRETKQGFLRRHEEKPKESHPILAQLSAQNISTSDLAYFTDAPSPRAIERAVEENDGSAQVSFATIAYAAATSKRQAEQWVHEKQEALMAREDDDDTSHLESDALMRTYGVPSNHPAVQAVIFRQLLQPQKPHRHASELTATIREIGLSSVTDVMTRWIEYYRPPTVQQAVKTHAARNSYRMLEEKAGMTSETLEAIVEGRQTITSLPALRRYCENVGIQCTNQLVADWMERFACTHRDAKLPDAARVVTAVIAICERIDKGIMPFLAKRDMRLKFFYGRHYFHETGILSPQKQTEFLEKTPVPKGTPLRVFLESVFARGSIQEALSHWLSVMHREFPELAEDCSEFSRLAEGEIDEDADMADETDDVNDDSASSQSDLPEGANKDRERQRILQTKFMISSQRAGRTTNIKDLHERYYLNVLRILQHLPGVTMDELTAAIREYDKSPPPHPDGQGKILDPVVRYEYSILGLQPIPTKDRATKISKHPLRVRVHAQDGGPEIREIVGPLSSANILAIIRDLLDPEKIDANRMTALAEELSLLDTTDVRRLAYLGDTIYFPGSPERQKIYRIRVAEKVFLSPSSHPYDIKDETAYGKQKGTFAALTEE